MVKNPASQILRYWIEKVEFHHSYSSEEQCNELYQLNPLKILYKGLSKVNKSLGKDLLKWILKESEEIDIAGIVYSFTTFF